MNATMDRHPTPSEVLDLILSCVDSILPNKDQEITPETRLLGSTAVIDSMGLVNLIVEVEQRLSEQFGVACTLADERAMSRQKSPFRSVRSFAEYVVELIHGPSESVAG
jgi:acyl carrier protein